MLLTTKLHVIFDRASGHLRENRRAVFMVSKGYFFLGYCQSALYIVLVFGLLCDHIDFICTGHQDLNTLVLNDPHYVEAFFFFHPILWSSVGRDICECHQDFWWRAVSVPVSILSVFDWLPLVRECTVPGKITYNPPPPPRVVDAQPLVTLLQRIIHYCFPCIEFVFYCQICSACHVNNPIWI